MCRVSQTKFLLDKYIAGLCFNRTAFTAQKSGLKSSVFHSKLFSQISPKSYRHSAVPNRFSSHFSTSRTNGLHLLSRVKAGTHSAFRERSHTRAHTPKQGPSLPRPQHGLVPSAKFLLVLHAFIYIHFPVHCEPSTPAEEKNLSKLPSQTLSQTIFHRVFQLLPQTAHVCFHSRKRVHTRLRQQDRTQRPTRRNTGLPDGAAITTLDTYCTFTNFPGPGIRTANFAAFEPWPEVLSKNAESLRDSDALMRVAVPQASRPRWAA